MINTEIEKMFADMSDEYLQQAFKEITQYRKTNEIPFEGFVFMVSFKMCTLIEKSVCDTSMAVQWILYEIAKRHYDRI